MSNKLESSSFTRVFGSLLDGANDITPVVPYAWQAKDEQIEIFPQCDKKVNIFGILRPDNVAITY